MLFRAETIDRGIDWGRIPATPFLSRTRGKFVADPTDLRVNTGDRHVAAENLLGIARQAATEKQPDRMLEALAASGFLDGLTNRLEKDWRGRLPHVEIEECVATAVDGAYDAVARGHLVRNLGAWIWKAASNRAIDRWNDDYKLRTALQTESIEDRWQYPGQDADADRRLSEYRANEAIRLARLLLPRIGQGQVVDVMGIVIDAVERGIEDLSPTAIGEALGLSPDAVRSLLARGFERLEREARKEGVVLPAAVPDFIRDNSPEGGLEEV